MHTTPLLKRGNHKSRCTHAPDVASGSRRPWRTSVSLTALDGLSRLTLRTRQAVAHLTKRKKKDLFALSNRDADLCGRQEPRLQPCPLRGKQEKKNTKKHNCVSISQKGRKGCSDGALNSFTSLKIQMAAKRTRKVSSRFGDFQKGCFYISNWYRG